MQLQYRAPARANRVKVLFVCSGNAHRSPLEEALMKKLRPDFKVDSAGLHVVIPISGKIREYLTKQKADQYLKEAPQSLYQKQIPKYNLIVAMEDRHKNAILNICRGWANRIEVWNIQDPYFLVEPGSRSHLRRDKSQS